jgi:hypothetical protein
VTRDRLLHHSTVVSIQAFQPLAESRCPLLKK